MQRALSDYVQDVLASLGSDEVNSINDTIEAQTVARIVRRCFYNIVDEATLYKNKNLFQLETFGDATKPTLMTKPSDVRNIDWIKYDWHTTTDTDINYTFLPYLSLDEFFNLTDQLRQSDSDTYSFQHTIGTSTITFFVKNNVAPHYWTSFDDNTIAFDSYDSSVDTTLQKSKTKCFGEKLLEFELVDSFVPPLTDEQQNLLLNESISAAWVELKQAPNQKAEQFARKGWVRQQHTKQNLPTKRAPIHDAPNYGRTLDYGFGYYGHRFGNGW